MSVFYTVLFEKPPLDKNRYKQYNDVFFNGIQVGQPSIWVSLRRILICDYGVAAGRKCRFDRLL